MTSERENSTIRAKQFTLRTSLAVLTLTCIVFGVTHYFTLHVLIFVLTSAILFCFVTFSSWFFCVVVDAVFPPTVPEKEVGDDD